MKRWEMPAFFIAVTLAVVFFGSARAEIYKCTDADGSAIYAQMPCVSAPTTAVNTTTSDDPPIGLENLDDTEADAPSPEELPVDDQVFEIRAMPTTQQSATARSSNEVFVCKKPIRDQIDVIDVKMRSSYTSEQGKAYMQELRVLTQELRKCE